MLFRFTVCMAAVVAAPAGTAMAQAKADPLAGFDAYVAQAAKDWRVPGMAVVVVRGDSVLFMKGYGVRELGKPEPVTVHTAFGNMSTTKAFTSLLFAMLADSGRADFDDAVTKYLPDLELSDPYVTRELRVRDLLTHRLGFGDPSYLWARSGLSFDEIQRRVRLVPAASSFRSEFAYNNVGYALVGAVEGRVTATPWQTLVRKRILEPLGMTETWPTATEMEAAHVADVSAPHGIIRDTVRVLPAAASLVDNVAPAGAMFSTATDMAKWLRFLLDSGRVNGRRLVSAPHFAELFTLQQAVSSEEFYPTERLTHPHFRGYGMGWFLEDYRGEYVAFHTGSIEGRSAIVGLIPDRRIGVVVMTNLDHSEVRHALMYTAFDRLLGPGMGATHDWSAEMRRMYTAIRDSAETRRAARDARRVQGTQASLPLERYAGVYSDPLYGAVTIRKGGAGLSLENGERTGTLEHWNYDTFRVRWNDPFSGTSDLVFVLDATGSPSELRLDGARFRRR